MHVALCRLGLCTSKLSSTHYCYVTSGTPERVCMTQMLFLHVLAATHKEVSPGPSISTTSLAPGM